MIDSKRNSNKSMNINHNFCILECYITCVFGKEQCFVVES